MLHGSPHHLVGAALPDVPRPDLLTSAHGYARVTTTSDSGLVVASPLFVAYARQ